MKRLLLIEDDITVRENTAELLELSDYDVITASNGKLGVDKAMHHKPDIIICDIMMPEMDGYGVLQELAKDPETADIPFIFLSAKTEHKDIRKGMDLGADDYLTKPFEEEDLLSAIESRLAKVAILKSKQQKSQPKQVQAESGVSSLDELRQLMQDYEVLTYKAGDMVYEAGKMPNQFYMVKRGVVKAHRMDKQGKELITEVLADESYKVALKAKLIEEAKEVVSAQGTELVEEMADVYQVLESLITAYGFSKNQIETAQKRKLDKSGGFEKKLFLIDRIEKEL